MDEIYINLGIWKNTQFFMHTVKNENFTTEISTKIADYCGDINIVIFEFNKTWRAISLSREEIEYSIENLEIMLPALMKTYNGYFKCIKYDYISYQELICPFAPVKFLNVQDLQGLQKGTPKLEGVLYYLLVKQLN
jgi:hypothetical protein